LPIFRGLNQGGGSRGSTMDESAYIMEAIAGVIYLVVGVGSIC
jgi:hypothetical protein